MIIKEKSLSRIDEQGNRLYDVFCVADDENDLPDTTDYSIDEGSFALTSSDLYVTDSSRQWKKFGGTE